jgi:anti-sigma regulatory factor (Ser/Thr protein kinase)
MADFVADVVAEPDAISALSERATAFLAGEGVDARASHHVALVIDELLTNVAAHGGGARTRACIRLTVWPDRVHAEVSDYGAQFDPRTTRNIDLSVAADNRPIGGLGLYLIHRVAEELDYERDGSCNRTTFSVRRTPAADV